MSTEFKTYLCIYGIAQIFVFKASSDENAREYASKELPIQNAESGTLLVVTEIPGKPKDLGGVSATQS